MNPTVERPASWRSFVRRRPVQVLLVVLFVVAAALAAYGDWVWWEVYRGLTITLAAGALLLLAVVLATVPRGRPIALGLAAVGLGLVAGQNLGPSRPELLPGEGRLTVTLSAPREASGSAPATCARDEAGTELQVSGDFNLRLDILPDDPWVPASIDQREFVAIYLTVGDRWQPTRSDGRAFDVIVGQVVEAPESRMTAADSSTLEIDWTGDSGSARFAGLVPETRVPEATGEFIDLAGTVEWTCSGRPDL